MTKPIVTEKAEEESTALRAPQSSRLKIGCDLALAPFGNHSFTGHPKNIAFLKIHKEIVKEIFLTESYSEMGYFVFW